MKLEEVEKIPNPKEKIVYAIVMAILLYTEFTSMIRTDFSLPIVIFCIIMSGIVAGVIYAIVERTNIDYRHLKNTGKKITGRIIGIGDNIDLDKLNHDYYIVVEYNRKRKNIKKLKRNSAYKILENAILKENELEIPIDVYKKGIKLYFDLESVDIDRLKGYEDVKK